MKCQRCGRVVPRKQGRFCGMCPPTEKAPESLAAACAEVLRDLLVCNHHVLVGGAEQAKRHLDRLNAAEANEAKYER